MKARSRASYDVGLLLIIVFVVAVATATVYSRNAAQPQNPAAPQAQAQAQAPSPTPTPINWSTDPMLKRFVFRGIGPASMGGRVDDIAGVDSNPYTYYVGFATGGVWKTTNNGTTFQPIF